MGLQTGKYRVSEVLPETASLAHPGCLCIQGESSGTQVHDLQSGLQDSSSQCSGLLLGSSDLDALHSPPHSSCTGGGSTAADLGNSDLSGVYRSNVVASVVV